MRAIKHAVLADVDVLRAALDLVSKIINIYCLCVTVLHGEKLIEKKNILFSNNRIHL